MRVCAARISAPAELLNFESVNTIRVMCIRACVGGEFNLMFFTNLSEIWLI